MILRDDRSTITHNSTIPSTDTCVLWIVGIKNSIIERRVMNISNKDKISWHLILKCSEFFSPLITNEYCTIIYYQRQTHKSRSTVQFSYASAVFQTTCLNICQLLTSLCHVELTELTTCITNVLSILTQIKKMLNAWVCILQLDTIPRHVPPPLLLMSWFVTCKWWYSIFKNHRSFLKLKTLDFKMLAAAI